jgi:hypothetical protein
MCGGNSANTDRKQQLQAYGDLNSSIGTLNALGTGLSQQGAGATGQAVNYYSNLLSGDPNKVAAAAQPITSQINKQTSQAEKQISQFGNRGGGTNQAVQNLGSQARGQVSSALSGARNQAATGLATIGGQETGQGLESTLGAASTAGALGNLSMQSRGQSQAIHDQAVQQWTQAVSDVLEMAALA